MDTLFKLESLEFSEILEDVFSTLHDAKPNPSCNLQPEIFMLIKEDIKRTINENDYDSNNIKEALAKYDQEKVDRFSSVLDEKKEDLLYAALLHHNSACGSAISNFDWLIKLVLGTNDLKSLKYPLLQLILSSIDSKGEKMQSVYELNKDMLEKVISLLENIDEIN